jgi:hypothetical protein
MLGLVPGAGGPGGLRLGCGLGSLAQVNRGPHGPCAGLGQTLGDD